MPKATCRICAKTKWRPWGKPSRTKHEYCGPECTGIGKHLDARAKNGEAMPKLPLTKAEIAAVRSRMPRRRGQGSYWPKQATTARNDEFLAALAASKTPNPDNGVNT